MSRILYALVFGLLTQGCSGGDADAADAGDDGGPDSDSDTGWDPRFDELVEAVEAEMAAHGASAAAVAVIEGDQVTFARGFGTRSSEDPEPVGPDTLFRLASVSKSFCAVAVLQLVDDGLVDLDEPISTYLPDLLIESDPEAVDEITVRDLLRHTSALNDKLEGGFTPASDFGLATYVDEALGNQHYLHAPVGRMYNYCNPGFVIAGRIIEVVTGQPFREYVEQNVLQPLGLTRSTYLVGDAAADGDVASGGPDLELWGWEWLPEKEILEPEEYDLPWGWPAAGLFSSAAELAKWVLFLMHGDPDVLPDGLRVELTKPQIDTETYYGYRHYGIGLYVQQSGLYTTPPGADEPGDFYELDVVFHRGILPGYSAKIWYVPSLEFGFVALNNADLAHMDGSFAVALATLCDLPDPGTAPAPPNPEDWDAFVGSYHSDPTGTDVIVTREGDDLNVEIPLWDSYDWEYDSALVPVSDRSFEVSYEGWTMDVTFLYSESTLEYLRTRHFVATPATDATALSRARRPPAELPSAEVLAGEDPAFTGRRLSRPQRLW